LAIPRHFKFVALFRGFILFCAKFAGAVVAVSILGLVSCVIITKDEWVHKELSTDLKIVACDVVCCASDRGWIYFYEWLQNAPELGFAGASLIFVVAFSFFNVEWLAPLAGGRHD